jgi:hypothetical protein
MLVLCLLEYLKLNSRRERGESHFFIKNKVKINCIFHKYFIFNIYNILEVINLGGIQYEYI